MRDGREGEPAIALRWGSTRERAEPVVLPPDVGRPRALMRDTEPPLERTADDAAVAKDRTQDHLELHRVGRETAQRGMRIRSHAIWIGRGLLWPRGGVPKTHPAELERRGDDRV